MCPSRNVTQSYSNLGLHVLLVDDSAVQRVLATGLLLKKGLDVTCAKDGKEAVDACTRQDFYVVLMDVEMPVMDGLAATAEIRHREITLQKHTPIIALTSTSDRDRCFAAGMDAFAPKPLMPKDVEQILEIAADITSRSV